jgi:hypothetical protein
MEHSAPTTQPERTIAPVVRKSKLTEQPNDFAYWQTQSHEDRLAALEEIRREYYGYTAETEPPMVRVVTIAMRSEQASGWLQDLADLENLE